VSAHPGPPVGAALWPPRADLRRRRARALVAALGELLARRARGGQLVARGGRGGQLVAGGAGVGAMKKGGPGM
jgi:hypothetical protein